ncbi:MAG: TatD family hydrolase [Candidatus Uhrbacteria bacterium GW2011_GWF2_39_13]|uniref:TatD family hydrolase n=1 Tax=Candidatus Uhrbacteria bacterium GW2011_GWF2_39_13 TaxID=1618995 RepID=A0A0G0MNG7_9BACT|nr:MAG: TatD family hydrolase [Candidatus Uhrbacteria bacterium GW2011_GWF2_39_13]
MDEVIQRTLEQGTFMITVGTQRDTSRAGLEVAQRYQGMWASVGLHPNHTVEQTFWDNDELPPEQQMTLQIKTRCESFDMEYYRKLVQHPKCVALGETGLDYYRIPEGVDRQIVIQMQEQTVRAHFDLATEANLPVIIHYRDAYVQQAKLIGEYLAAGKLTRRGVIHCFTGTIQEAQSFLEQGFFISFSGILTFSKELQKVAKALPLQKLLVETDSPYLTPVPDRGVRNEPWRVKYVAQKLADLHGISLEQVAGQTFENTKQVFGLEI